MFELSVRGKRDKASQKERASLREKDALKLNTKGASKVDEFTDQLDAKRRKWRNAMVCFDRFFFFELESHTHTLTGIGSANVLLSRVRNGRGDHIQQSNLVVGSYRVVLGLRVSLYLLRDRSSRIQSSASFDSISRSLLKFRLRLFFQYR